MVGCELTIRTIVPPDISAEPFRKTMLLIIFIRRILSLSSSHYITISDMITTVVASFAMPAGSAEREAVRIMDPVRHTFFDVVNLQGIGFLDFSGR